MKLLRALLLLGLPLAMLPASAQAPTPEVVVAVGGTVTLPAPGFQKAQVINVETAGFEILPDGIRITGKELGKTRVVVWDKDNHTLTYQVTVVAPGDVDRERERSLMAALAADPVTRDAGLTVALSGDTATLSGTADNQAVINRALELLRPRIGQVVSQVQVRGAAAPAPAGGSATPTPRTVPTSSPTPATTPTAPATATNPAIPAVSAPGAAPVAAPVRPAGPLPGLPTLGVKLDDIKQAGSLELSVGEARLISVPTEVKRALIATDSVADVVMIPPREVAVIAKAPGDTTLMLWYIGADAFLGQQENAVVNVHVVGPPKDGQGTPGNLPSPAEVERLLALLGISSVQVLTHYDGTSASVILAGSVPSSLHRTRAEQAVAALFPTGARISNFIELARPPAPKPEALAAQQKRLEALLAEQLPNAAVRVDLRPDPQGDTVRVLLSGDAAIPADRLKAEQLVQFELGQNAQITNNIAIPLPPPPEELLGGAAAGPAAAPKPPILQAITQAIEATGVPLDRVQVNVFETPRKRVVLTGSVRSEVEQQELLDAVQGVVEEYGDYEVRDRGLSVKVARVVTEVQIVELTALASQQLGFTFGAPSGSNSGSGSTGGSSTQAQTSILNSNGQLVVYGERTPGGHVARLDPIATSIQALITGNKARVLQQPYIASNDQQQGTVELVTEVPLPSTTSGANGSTGVSVEFRPVGIRLLVTPRINWAEPQNQIEMTIQTEVSAIDFGIAINIGGSVIPSVTNRKAQSVVTVDDGETFVIGGLTSEQERKNVSRLPFISDIPIIGELFKSTTTTKNQTTVVVVMTPRIKW